MLSLILVILGIAMNVPGFTHKVESNRAFDYTQEEKFYLGMGIVGIVLIIIGVLTAIFS